MVKEKALIEAILFAAGDPVSLNKLKSITGIKENNIKDNIKELQEDYIKRDAGIELREVAGGYLMATCSIYAPYINKLFADRTRQGLSQAALETLAIIAYKQPITRLEIEAIRGVKIDRILDKLKENKLIIEVGRKDAIGRPILYGTSREFLKRFGLKSLSELPPLEEYLKNEE